jgi:hypothetical protein
MAQRTFYVVKTIVNVVKSDVSVMARVVVCVLVNWTCPSQFHHQVVLQGWAE